MTTENKETKFDVRTATGASRRESPTKHDLNSIYGITGKTVRPTIQFVPGNTERPKGGELATRREVGSIATQDTTESRLSDVREQMTFTRAKKTVRRTGWYFTEPYAPCGSLLQSSPFSQQAESGLNDIKSQIKSVFGA